MRCVNCDTPTTDTDTCVECSPNGHDPLGLEDIHVHTVDVDKADSQVTRHLCCAAQSDEWFAQKLMSMIIRQPCRGIAKSPGVDIGAVLRHACAARRRRAWRDTILTGVNLPALLILLGSIIVAIITLSLEPLRAIPPVLGVSIVASSATTFIFKLSYNHAITDSLSREHFSVSDAPDPQNRLLRARILEIERQSHGNITIYRGFKPFRGYGKVIGGWSFAIDITKPKEHSDKKCSSFAVREIRDYVQRQVEALEWLGLRVEERIFVSGRDVSIGETFIGHDGRPRATITGREVRKLLSEPDNRARPYTVIRLLGWDGELALTIFLRFVIVQRNLFIEASHSILTPLQASFRRHDKVKRVEGWRGNLGLALRSIRLLHRPVSGFTHLGERRDDRRALIDTEDRSTGPELDYGAFFSAREWASDERYQRYFQKLDSEMYTKVVEQRIFDALVQFLDEHNIDTGDLMQRQTTILNNGVMVTGSGTINAENVAGGAGAHAGHGEQKSGGKSNGS